MTQFVQRHAIYLGEDNNSLGFLGWCLLNYKNLLQPVTVQMKESVGYDMQHAAHTKSLDNQFLVVANNFVLTNECLRIMFTGIVTSSMFCGSKGRQ